MASKKLRTFEDIYTAICEELKIPVTDTKSLDRIKRAINIKYLEVAGFKRWPWLTKSTKVVHKAFYTGGTATVTPDSATVTLSTSPALSKGSFKGHYFAVDSFSEIYEISAHTAGSTTLTLTSTYQGVISSTASFKIWTDKVALPTDAREVIEAYHQRMTGNMEGIGFQELREFFNNSPRLIEVPKVFNVNEYFDPTPDDAETESDRYRYMRVWPAVYAENVTINIDYIHEVTELDDEEDEPVIPLEERKVLYYAGLAWAWDALQRDANSSGKNQALYEQTLARMAGKVEAGYDKPRTVISSQYMTTKRGPRFRSSRWGGLGSSEGSASGYSAPSYLADVTINGASITGNVTVSSGITIDGRDISADGAILDTLNALADGKIFVGDSSNETAQVTPTGDVTITNTGVTAIAAGVIVNADINSSAAITKSKLAAGTASRVEVTDGSGNLTESTVTSTEVTFLADVEPLTSASLSDNQASAANVATWTAASYDSIVIEYSLKRGSSNKEVGRIYLATDGTNASIAQSGASIGTLGVTFSADVSSGSLRLRYTSTSTGTAPTMKYKIQKWLA